MLGKIKSIKEVHGKKINDFESCEGFEVITDKHEFYVLISEYQACCESFGYLTSDDDPKDFISKELLEIKLTDTDLNKIDVSKEFEYGFDEGGIQFVDFITENGTLQLAVYNSHNGYYGHGIYVLQDARALLEESL